MTRSQSEPIGIGVPTGTCLGPRQIHCPGACLRVTRHDYEVLKREGHVWATGAEDIRTDGMSDARTFCHRDVALIRVPQGQRDGKTVFAVCHAALCSSCADLERNNRADLVARRALAEHGPKR